MDKSILHFLVINKKFEISYQYCVIKDRISQYKRWNKIDVPTLIISLWLSQYVKQCNEVYPNDMQRNHTSPFEIAHQNQSFSSKDTSCIEMFDLAMYASNKENSLTSSTQSALSKNKGSIENVNYVRYFIIFNFLLI